MNRVRQLNDVSAGDCAVASCLQFVRPGRLAPDRQRSSLEVHSAEMRTKAAAQSVRAQRATLKSRRDDLVIAQGKRSAALGCRPKMISSLFSFSALVRRKCALNIFGGVTGIQSGFNLFPVGPPLGPFPQLHIVKAGSNLVLSWPTNSSGFNFLGSSTDLSSPAWTYAFPPTVMVNGQNFVTNPISAPQQFFRLSQ
ncbi:MAG TPA: hypothetical protein VKY92_01840 [Verrucomicrobiae bacterium]|nr:hypothetical protein [Verrucomicrobiae bacterium]